MQRDANYSSLTSSRFHTRNNLVTQLRIRSGDADVVNTVLTNVGNGVAEWKAPGAAATNPNQDVIPPVTLVAIHPGTIPGSFLAGQTIDGETVAENDTVLLIDQVDPIENGVYVATGTTFTRASYFLDNLSGAEVHVITGTRRGASYKCTSVSGSDTAGTHALTFAQHGASFNGLDLRQPNFGIALGKRSGQTSQGTGAVAVGYESGQSNQGQWAVAVGGDAGGLAQGQHSVAVGDFAASTSQGDSAVAIGSNTGKFNQGNFAIAVGTTAGISNQGVDGVAIGRDAAATNQSDQAIAVGVFTAQNSQGVAAVAIGALAGQSNQGNTAIAIGPSSAVTSQGQSAVAIGVYAGETIQGTQSVAAGESAGRTSQGNYSVAVGLNSAFTSQGESAVAVGNDAGKSNQGNQTVAIGNLAAETSQSLQSIAIGGGAGRSNQNIQAIAVGFLAGQTSQGTQATAIGLAAGQTNQGNYALALGHQAGLTSQAIRSIVINAQGVALENTTADSCRIAPIRTLAQSANAKVMTYDTSTKEIACDDAITVSNLTMTGNLLDTNGNELAAFASVGSAVNSIQIGNAVTTAQPYISAVGDDANIDLRFISKGTGMVESIDNFRCPTIGIGVTPDDTKNPDIQIGDVDTGLNGGGGTINIWNDNVQRQQLNINGYHQYLHSGVEPEPTIQICKTNSGTGNQLFIEFKSGAGGMGLGSQVGYLSNLSNVMTLVDASDVRLKENITTYSNGYNKVKALRVVEFNFKDADRKAVGRLAGFIAQEVKPVLPKCVMPIDGDSGDPDDPYLGIGTKHMIPFLWSACRTMIDKIESDQQRIADLEARVTALEGVG